MAHVSTCLVDFQQDYPSTQSGAGQLSFCEAIIFLLAFLPFTAIGAVVRPFAMEILLLEAKENVGLGLIITTSTFLSVVLWIMIKRGIFGAARQAASDLT